MTRKMKHIMFLIMCVCLLSELHCKPVNSIQKHAQNGRSKKKRNVNMSTSKIENFSMIETFSLSKALKADLPPGIIAYPKYIETTTPFAMDYNFSDEVSGARRRKRSSSYTSTCSLTLRQRLVRDSTESFLDNELLSKFPEAKFKYQFDTDSFLKQEDISLHLNEIEPKNNIGGETESTIPASQFSGFSDKLKDVTEK